MNTLIQLYKKHTQPKPANLLANDELAEAQRELLRYQSDQEYAAAMVQYQSVRVARLQRYLQGQQRQVLHVA